MAADNYQVICWVNHPKTFIQSMYINDNNSFFGRLPRNLTIKKSSELIELLLKSDISCKREIVRIIELEAAGAAYNYSTMSDFFRFLCLYFYGGIYLDCDSIPLEKFPHPSQIRAMRQPTQSMLIIYDNSNILISMPEHVILREILQNMVTLYHKGSAYPQYFGMTWLDAKRITKPGRWSNSIELGPITAQSTIEEYSRTIGLAPETFYLRSTMVTTNAEKMLIPAYSDQTIYFIAPALGKLVFYFANSWTGVSTRASTYEDITDPHRNKMATNTMHNQNLYLSQKTRLMLVLLNGALNKLTSLMTKTSAPMPEASAKQMTPAELKGKLETLKQYITLNPIKIETALFECIDKFVICAKELDSYEYRCKPPTDYMTPTFTKEYLPYIDIILSRKYMSWTKQNSSRHLADILNITSISDLTSIADPRTSFKKASTLSESQQLLDELMNQGIS